MNKNQIQGTAKDFTGKIQMESGKPVEKKGQGAEGTPR